MLVENITFEGHKGLFIPAKKIDMGSSYLIFVYGIQCPKGDTQRVVTDDVAGQTRLVFQEIEKILTLAGASLDHVVKAVIYLTDMADFEIVSPIRGEYFKNALPVSTVVGVNRLTRDGAKIEIEVTAVLDKE